MTHTTLQRQKSIYRVTWIGFFVNVILTAAKLLAGVIGHSAAMLADGIHSLSDFLTDLVVLLFIKVSSKPKDASHQYGHGKYETLGTIFIGITLVAVAIGIVLSAIGQIRQVANGEVIAQPGMVALIAAALSIAAKEALFWYTIAVAKRVNSPAVKANAWHHRSDAFSSIGTLIGIGGAYFLGERWRILDPIAAIVVAILIAKVAYSLIVPGINELLERALPTDQEREIVSLILQESAVSDLHNLRTRRIGANIAIEFHVRVAGDMTVRESHRISVEIENRLRQKYGEETLVVVHIEPIK